jgi:HEAT repeat protein
MVFSDEAKGLWLRALERPEADLRCKAAEAIALAHQRGMEGLETTVGPLVQALDQAGQHPAVRLAIARTLVALDAREAAPSLLQHGQADGREMREIVEPALARWDHRPARAVWLERLRDPTTPQRSLVLAIHGLALVREEQAVDPLRELALSKQTAGSIRLECARALGVIRSEGLEKDAEQLAGDASPYGLVARLAAASLLSRHRSDEAIRILQRLGDDTEPAVAVLAIGRLVEIDPDLVAPTVEKVLANVDEKIRSLGVEVLFRRPTEGRLRLLADRLDDPHMEVRVKARQSLLDLAANKDFKDLIIAEAMRKLGGTDWRGLEQAAILLTQLDHKPAAARLVELLPYERPEVKVTAGWGLRKLAVRETLPRVLSYVSSEMAGVMAEKEPNRALNFSMSIEHQFSQLNQFLGREKYAPADAMLRKFIPHRSDLAWDESRAAAVWALGLIHEKDPAADLSALLAARLNDTMSIPPEDVRVRQMAAVALARMQAKETVPSLRKYYFGDGPSVDSVSNACGWGLEQLTGEVMPPPKTFRDMQRVWFLTPEK